MTRSGRSSGAPAAHRESSRLMRAGQNVAALLILAPPPRSALTEGDGVIFENEHAVLQRFVAAEGEWDAADSHVVPLLTDDSSETETAFIYMTLKSDELLTPDNPPELQQYPNIPLELVFENDRLRVQRARIEPGVFEGVHGHPGNQIFLHIKGGTWSAIKDGEPIGDVIVREAGESGWMDAVHEHEYGNVGDTTIDLVWITLK